MMYIFGSIIAIGFAFLGLVLLMRYGDKEADAPTFA